jgi:signal transduction histidine kinase
MSRPRARLRAGVLAQDTVLAAGVCLTDLLVFSDLLKTDAGRDKVLSSVALLAYATVGCGALIWRRRAPVAVFALVWAHSLISTQLPRYAATIGLAVALYTVAAYCRITTARTALLLSGLPLGLAVANQVHSATPSERTSTLLGSAVVQGLLYGVAWGAARWTRMSRQRAADLEYRRQTAARDAVSSERIRIARELHDIVAHSVTVMVMQAGGAERIVRTNPARAEQALAQIGECGTQAIGELGRMLRVLRTGGDGDEADEELALGDPPRLSQLGALLEGVRHAGVEVTLEARGEPGQLDPSVDLTAYRIVQEALTNVSKHAGAGTHATVTIRWADDLLVEVRNDHGATVQRPTRSLSTGHGLLGLRERTSVAGGRLTAASTGDGGFRLTATLPLARTAASPAMPG